MPYRHSGKWKWQPKFKAIVTRIENGLPRVVRAKGGGTTTLVAFPLKFYLS